MLSVQGERGGRVAPSDDPHVLAFQDGCCNRERLQFLTHARGNSRQIREAQFPAGIEEEPTARGRYECVPTDRVPSILFNCRTRSREWNNHLERGSKQKERGAPL